ncbi:KPN_02809 family neutral zinc metallopeptidase [Dysgonomonas massiliensis]|uniref:KPN_02809 family neutral zinc metallopeptidase n=1 Tax=Dysgonomonas massiliensis TaxID=2040292 RepID=UPI000C77860A|nr:neutral zinc metallopeptidase [Dysgonomonas massiliensis]
MRLDGRRESDNVDDRRRSGSKGKASLGIGGLIIVGLIVWLTGGNPMDVVTSQLGDNLTMSESTYEPTAEEDALAKFSNQILRGTEEVWTDIFAKNGMTYVPPKMVLYTRATTSGCGNASSSTGPFYCPADQTVYIDLSFFEEMETKLSAGGDFAYAYVIAHEVGHHVQYLLGVLADVQKQQQRMSEKESNKLNIRLELQADFYAGIWAYHDNKKYSSLEEGDIDEGLNAASQIGDDRLQMQAQGYTVPDSFNHGTSAQRSRWLKKGLQTGNVSDGDTFSVSFSSL